MFGSNYNISIFILASGNIEHIKWRTDSKVAHM